MVPRVFVFLYELGRHIRPSTDASQGHVAGHLSFVADTPEDSCHPHIRSGDLPLSIGPHLHVARPSFSACLHIAGHVSVLPAFFCLPYAIGEQGGRCVVA